MVDASDRGGIATYTSQLRSALVAEGVEVLMAAPPGVGDEGRTLATRRWGPDVESLSKLALYRLRLAELGPAYRTFMHIVETTRPDVVHVQTEITGLDAVALRRIAQRVPVVITAHDPIPQNGGVEYLTRQARRWRVADAVIIHGNEPRQLVAASAGGTPVHVVPVDLRLGGPRVPRDEARRRLGLDDRPTAILLGQLRPYKGVELLAAAWPGVAKALPEARLLVVGQPYDCPGLDELGRVPGVELRKGFVPEARIDWWAAAADVLVLPYEVGTHSGVLHRGMAAGTPVLASPVLAEEVHRTGAGLVVPLSAGAWTESLVDALGDRPLPVPPEPTGTETARGTIAVYRSVIEARSPRRLRTAPESPSRDRPIRVVYYVEGDVFGGVERHLITLLDELDRERFEPLVLGTMAEELTSALDARGVAVTQLDKVRNKVDLVGWARVAWSVGRSRPDVFHAMLSHSFASPYALTAAVLRRTPAVVVTAHLPTASKSRFQRALQRFLLRGVDLQILPSEWTRSALLELGQLHHSDIEVVANGIALPPLQSRQQARRALGLDPDALVIGGSMRLVEWKRPELVVESARGLPGATVVFFGEGPEEANLRSVGREMDVRLLGFRTDAVSLLPALDIFVHPCPSDNQPIAVLEAMGAGLAVVVADAGGTVFMVEDGIDGLRASATPEGMAKAVHRLAGDPALRARLAASARAKAAVEFSGTTMARQVERIYERLLGRLPPPSPEAYAEGV